MVGVNVQSGSFAYVPKLIKMYGVAKLGLRRRAAQHVACQHTRVVG